MKLVIVFALVLAILLGLDLIWLGTTLGTLYRPNMGNLLSPTPNLWAAAGFYVVYGFALSYLIILPAASTEGRVNRRDLTVRAGLFGLAAFATYDLTGLSVIRDWPLTLSLIDMAWGTFAAAVAANLSVVGLRLLGQIR